MRHRLTVACLTVSSRHRYREIANAMAQGINEYGDRALMHPADHPPLRGVDCAVMYGWKRHEKLARYPQYVYADLGYWDRKNYYRLCVGGWSPHRYVKANLSPERLRSFGVEIKPWNTHGNEVLVLGASRKSMHEHGRGYRTWEFEAVTQLRGVQNIVYRPKPTDPERARMDRALYEERPLEQSLLRAKAVVAHHSNACIDALVAGVPVHCETGVAAAFSVPLASVNEPARMEGREQFLADVAWLQWSVAEMKSGAAWAHLRERELVR